MEKPLHVQVAEALGWKALRFDSFYVNEDGSPDGESFWHGEAPAGTCAHSALNPMTALMGRLSQTRWAVPYFNTDWSAIGLLIERHVTGLVHYGPEFGGYWQALQYNLAANGDTPLLAVCNLILALAEAGKLGVVNT